MVERRAWHVDYRKHPRAPLFSLLDAFQHVGSLAALRNRHHERLAVHFAGKVLELRANHDVAVLLGHLVEQIPANQRRVPAGSARHEHHPLGPHDFAADFLEQFPVLAQRLENHFRLFRDFLLHEMREPVLARFLGLPVQRQFLRHFSSAVKPPYFDFPVFSHYPGFAFPQDNRFFRKPKERDRVAGRHRARFSACQNKRAAVPGGDYFVRRAGPQEQASIRADDLLQRVAYRKPESVAPGFSPKLFFDQVSQHFGVRLRLEHVPVSLQSVPKLLEVLYYAVVHHRDLSGAVRVRVRVFVRHPSRSRPPRVADSRPSLEALFQLMRQVRHFADFLSNRDFAAVDCRGSGRVVPPVLKRLEAFKQHRRRLPCPDKTHYSAHFSKPSSGNLVARRKLRRFSY